MRTAHTISLGAAVPLTSAPLAAPSLEARAIMRVKQLPAARLEAGLSREPFAQWFRKTVGPSAKITWDLNDCGEQTGAPAVRLIMLESKGQFSDVANLRILRRAIQR
ncbi:MAG: hypothetical protein ACT4PY_09915 [Armatimonadota bacterium]